MTQYYLPPPAVGPPFDGVISDAAEWVPADPLNSHWIEYQAWLAEGNEPLPYSQMPLPSQRQDGRC